MSDTNARPTLTGFEGTFGDLVSDKADGKGLPTVGRRSDVPGQLLRTPVPPAASIRGGVQAQISSDSMAPRGVQDIFLSPRVVDRQAFNDFSRSLRELIDQAAAGSESLRRSALEAEQARTSLRETIASQQVKLEQSTKLLAQADQKAQQTRKLIEEAGDPAATIEAMRVRLDHLVEEKLAKLIQHVEEGVRDAEGHMVSVGERLAPLMREADRRITSLNGQLDAQLAPSIAGLQRLCERADTIIGKAGPDGMTDGTEVGGLNNLVIRAERTKDEAALAFRQLDSVREQADQARRILGEALHAAMPLIDEVASVQGHLESTITRATELGKTTQDNISKALATQREVATQTIGQLGTESGRLRAELTEAIEYTHQARRAASQAAVTGEEAAGHLTRLLDRLEPWHGVLLASTGGDQLPLPLRDVLNTVRVELKRDLAGVASALRAVAERTERAIETETPLPGVLSEAKSQPASIEISTESQIESKAEGVK